MSEINRSKNFIVGDISNVENIQIGDKVTTIYQVLGFDGENLSSEIIWTELKSTKVFKRIESISEENKRVKKLIAIIAVIITHKKINEDFPSYADENIKHTINILKIYDRIISEHTLKLLNEVELTILILSAYLHDTGIMLSPAEKEMLIQDEIFEEFIDENKDVFNYVKAASNSGRTDIAKKIEHFLIKHFLKANHYERTFEYIKHTYTDLLEYNGSNFSGELAFISASHSIETWELGKKEQIGRSNIDKYRRNKLIGGLQCNLQYIAICLKIADLLSFDDEFFDLELLSYFNLNTELSFETWKTHLNSQNWQIGDRDIIYEIQCCHPVYQHYLISFLDFLEDELDKCTFLIADNNHEISSKYQLSISRKINRDYIEPLDFIYGPFKFDLNYDKIVNILMGERLYNGKSIAIREILQNSIDACKLRSVFEKISNI